MLRRRRLPICGLLQKGCHAVDLGYNLMVGGARLTAVSFISSLTQPFQGPFLLRKQSWEAGG